MPHDQNGILVEVGAVVSMDFIVTSVYTGTDDCNVQLESVDPIYHSQHKTSLGTVNTKQVRVVSRPAPADPPAA